MYETQFGFRRAPFSLTPDPRFLYLSAHHREALAHLLYGVGEGGGFVQLTGEVGTGKTTLCRSVLEQAPEPEQTTAGEEPTPTGEPANVEKPDQS